jgi:hypothetical protein
MIHHCPNEECKEKTQRDESGQSILLMAMARGLEAIKQLKQPVIPVDESEDEEDEDKEDELDDDSISGSRCDHDDDSSNMSSSGDDVVMSEDEEMFWIGVSDKTGKDETEGGVIDSGAGSDKHDDETREKTNDNANWQKMSPASKGVTAEGWLRRTPPLIP